MKKYLSILLALLLILTGCSSGISQADYDAMVAERNAALEENQALKEKLAAYDPNWEAEETEPAQETTVREENIAELLSIETVEWETHCDLIVTNNSTQLVEATFAIKYFDAAGNIIGIGNVSTEALGAGASHLLEARNDSVFEYAEVSVTSAKADDRYSGSMENVTCNDYVVNGKKVIFEVTNNGNAAVDFVRASVLFYNGDEVVDSGSAYATDTDYELKPGATLMEEVSTNKTFTDYRIFYYGRIDP